MQSANSAFQSLIHNIGLCIVREFNLNGDFRRHSETLARIRSSSNQEAH